MLVIPPSRRSTLFWPAFFLGYLLHHDLLLFHPILRHSLRCRILGSIIKGLL